MPVVAIDDQHVAIAAGRAAARRAAFDPVRLRDRFVGNRIERKALAGRVIDAVALVAVVELTPRASADCRRRRRTGSRRCSTLPGDS